MPGDDEIRSLIARAVLAPSSHNTQPWLFEIGDNHLRLYADRTRALPVNDPHDRELTISCGAALMTLRVAAAARGTDLTVSLLPDARDEDLLAECTFVGTPEAALAPLDGAIDQRRTYRRMFLDYALPSAVLKELADAAAAEGAGFHVLADEASRNAAAALVAKGDQLLWADVRWRRELAAWMHRRRSGDGLSVPWLALPAARLAVRTFDMGDSTGEKDLDVANGSPVLAILGTDADTTGAWLRAGTALQRLLLAATANGVQASYLNQPIQVETLRPELAKVSGGIAFPQVMLRLGYPDADVPASPRRPLADVIMDEIRPAH